MKKSYYIIGKAATVNPESPMEHKGSTHRMLGTLEEARERCAEMATRTQEAWVIYKAVEIVAPRRDVEVKQLED